MEQFPDQSSKGLSEEGDNHGWQVPDAKVIRLWKTRTIIALAVIYLVVFTPGIILWLTTLFPGFILIIVLIPAVFFFCFAVFWLPVRHYAASRCRLSEHSIELRSGALFSKSVLIPLTRIQHVDLHRGPFEQRLGLSTLAIHTAGTRAASHKFEGLREEVAGSLRDALVERARLKAK